MKNIDFRNGQQLIMMVSQYDYGYNLQVALWTNGEPVTITAAEIVSENFTVACTFSGNVVTIPVTTSMTERFGHFPAELRVTDSLGQVSTKNFDWFVERSPLAVKSTETYSGDIVEFTAKSVPLSSVVVTMEPIQDLNGYDSPWPAGGGKNQLKITAQTSTVKGVTFTVNADGSVTVNGTTTENNCFFNLNYAANQINVPTDTPFNIGMYGKNRPRTLSIQCVGNGGNNVVAYAGEVEFGISPDSTLASTSTTTATWVRLQIQTAGTTINNVTVYPFWCYSSNKMTAYEPYSNVCPITGRTGASVVVAGKNVLKSVPQDHSQSGVGVIVNDDGTVSLSGTATSTSIAIMNFEHETTISGEQNIGKKCLPNGKYKLSVGNSNNAFRLQVLGSNNASGTSGVVALFDANNGEITIDDTYAYNWVRLYVANGTNCSGITLYPMIRQASIEDDTYEPYNGAGTYPITFTSAGTVYAGTVDFVSGRLVVTHANISSYNGETINEPWISSMDKYVAGATPTTGAQVVYPLATPLTYNLTPTQVMSLLGENVVWSPDGEVEVVVPEFYS